METEMYRAGKFGLGEIFKQTEVVSPVDRCLFLSEPRILLLNYIPITIFLKKKIVINFDRIYISITTILLVKLISYTNVIASSS